jgi:glycosyltransferase involved in cell wall biosynthesis
MLTALLVADRLFAAREQAMLSRIEVGLADEGVRVLHALPEDARGLISADAAARGVTYRPRGPLPSLRVRAAAALEAALAQPVFGEGAKARVDIVHAFGRDAWPISAEIARQAEAPLVLEVWRAALVDRLTSISRIGRHGLPAVFTPDRTIERVATRASPGRLVRVVPWGVHCPREPRAHRNADRACAIMIAGRGEDKYAIAECLAALGRLVETHNAMVFMDAEAGRRAGAAAIARQHGFLQRFSLAPDLEGRREPVLRGDLLLLPEALGEHRSIALDAMASGMAVVALADPYVRSLIDGRTCVLVKEAASDLWTEALAPLLASPEAAHALAERAREFIRTERRASVHVASLLDGYEWLTSSQSLSMVQ